MWGAERAAPEEGGGELSSLHPRPRSPGNFPASRPGARRRAGRPGGGRGLAGAGGGGAAPSGDGGPRPTWSRRPNGIAHRWPSAGYQQEWAMEALRLGRGRVGVWRAGFAVPSRTAVGGGRPREDKAPAAAARAGTGGWDRHRCLGARALTLGIF